jgi:hypothetical protein
MRPLLLSIFDADTGIARDEFKECFVESAPAELQLFRKCPANVSRTSRKCSANVSQMSRKRFAFVPAQTTRGRFGSVRATKHG